MEKTYTKDEVLELLEKQRIKCLNSVTLSRSSHFE